MPHIDFIHILFDVIIVTVLYYTLKNLKGYTDKIEQYKKDLQENKDKLQEINKDLELSKEVYQYRSYMLYIVIIVSLKGAFVFFLSLRLYL